jgi:hypothetical protein
MASSKILAAAGRGRCGAADGNPGAGICHVQQQQRSWWRLLAVRPAKGKKAWFASGALHLRRRLFSSRKLLLLGVDLYDRFFTVNLFVMRENWPGQHNSISITLSIHIDLDGWTWTKVVSNSPRARTWTWTTMHGWTDPSIRLDG